MKKRNLLGATLLCGAGLFALASCGEDTSKTIVFYCSAGNSIVPAIEAKIKAFNDANPDWTVKIVNPGDYDKLKDKVKADLKVNNQPAIAYCYPDHIAEYLGGDYKDKVIDLQSRFINGDDSFKNIDFVDAYYEEGKIFEQGKVYTLPFVKSTEAMYVNTDMLAAAGVQLSELETWESIFKEGGALDKLKAKNPKVTPMGIDSSDNLFITLCEQYGIPYTAAGATDEETYLFNNEKVEKMLVALNKECQGKKITTRAVLNAYTSTKFVNKEIAISIGSTGGASHQDPSNGKKGSFNYAVLPYPHKEGEAAKSISQGPSLVMFEQVSDEKENVAWQFVKTLFDDDLQSNFPQKTGYMPVTDSVENYQAYKEFLAGESIIASTIKMATSMKDKLFVSPAFNGSNKAREQVGIALNEALAAKDNVPAKVKAALQAAYDECIFFN